MEIRNEMQGRKIPLPVAAGICLALASIIFGFSLGGAFGLIEDSLKKHLNDSGERVIETVYKGDAAAKKAVVGKSWDYLKRAHLHAGGIGAAALGSIAIMLLLCPNGGMMNVSAVSFGAGALGYSLFWLLAGLSAPGLGSTGAAKEALSYLAIPSAGLCLIGVVGTLFCVSGAMFSRRE